MSQSTLTRRGFVKSAAAMGAVAALGISAADSLTAVDPAHAAEAGEEKIVKTSCRACIASCAVLAHVRDGRVVKIEGNPESPMSQGGVCAKGLAGIQALYHPNRNKYPMRRVGERGTNQWERISWEEALTEVATKINEVSDKYGSEAISVSTGGRALAELLLSTTEWLETNLAIPQLNTIVMRQAVTHLFETVEEGIIWTQIVQKCAELGNTHCPKAFDEAACMTTPFYKNEYEKQLQHLNKLEMNWGEACEKGVIEWATPEEYRTYQTYLNDDAATLRRPGRYQARCNAVAERYGLSPRERDVFDLLVRGRSIDYIAQSLTISFNTAKSHIRHIYVKVDVHSRQELLDLIDQEAD